MVPEFGLTKASKSLSSVVFPTPVSPITATIVPGLTSIEKLDKTGVSLLEYEKVTLLTLSETRPCSSTLSRLSSNLKPVIKISRSIAVFAETTEGSNLIKLKIGRWIRFTSCK